MSAQFAQGIGIGFAVGFIWAKFTSYMQKRENLKLSALEGQDEE